MSDFKKLAVWRKAHALSINVSRVAATIRSRDHSALRSQMIRAAGSIPTNIVEGRAMKGPLEFARFLGYSIASTSELEYHLISARDQNVIRESDFLALMSQLIEVRKMLYGLLRALRNQGE